MSETHTSNGGSQEVGDPWSNVDLDADYKELDLVRVYLNQAAREPLLTAEEEVELSKSIEAGVFAKDLHRRHFGEVALTSKNTKKTVPLRQTEITHSELLELIGEGEKAKDRLIKANLLLVVSLAKRRMHTAKSLSFLDLIQEGTFGLFRAVEKFDYRKGFKFSTYATWHIRRFIDRGIDDHDRAVYLPQRVIDDIKMMERKERDLPHQLGRLPTREELAEAMGTTPEKIKELKHFARSVVSLDVAASHAINPDSLGDLILGEDSVDEHLQQLMKRQDIEDLIGLIDTYDAKKADIFRRAFGLSPYEEPQTMLEIAEALGCKRHAASSQVRSIIEDLRKLVGSENSAPFTVTQARK